MAASAGGGQKLGSFGRTDFSWFFLMFGPPLFGWLIFFPIFVGKVPIGCCQRTTAKGRPLQLPMADGPWDGELARN